MCLGKRKRIVCKSGSATPNNTASCEVCAPGTVAKDPIQIGCTRCPAHSFKASATDCAPCASDTYSNATSTVCESIPRVPGFVSAGTGRCVEKAYASEPKATLAACAEQCAQEDHCLHFGFSYSLMKCQRFEGVCTAAATTDHLLFSKSTAYHFGNGKHIFRILAPPASCHPLVTSLVIFSNLCRTTFDVYCCLQSGNCSTGTEVTSEDECVIAHAALCLNATTLTSVVSDAAAPAYCSVTNGGGIAFNADPLAQATKVPAVTYRPVCKGLRDVEWGAQERKVLEGTATLHI